MSKINTAWINFSSITKRWARDGEDVISALKIHPLELVVLVGSFVGVLGCLTLVVTNRADLLVIWAGELYEAIPKVFK